MYLIGLRTAMYGRLRPYLNKIAQATFDGLASAEFIIFQIRPYLKRLYCINKFWSLAASMGGNFRDSRHNYPAYPGGSCD